VKQFIVVLGVHHALQGGVNVPEPLKIDDPTYGRFVTQLINEFSLDYIFEEASGLGPTTASKLQRPGLGYSDVDPSGPERIRLEMPSGLSEVQEALWREAFWVRTIANTSFKNGLMICGVGHTLGVAARLEGCGFSVDIRTHIVPRELPASADVAVAILDVLRRG